MKIQQVVLFLLAVACTKSTATQTNTSGSNPPSVSLTGTWQGAFDGGPPPTSNILQYVLIEDAGTLSGVSLINDPLVPTQFHTTDVLSGIRSGSSVVLHTTVTGDTITATFDGGTLVGVDPFSEPLVFRDGGPAYQLNIPFSMQRISMDATIADGGFQ
jgi:hypothetical protein